MPSSIATFNGSDIVVAVATPDGMPAKLTVRTVSNAEEATEDGGKAGVVKANPVVVGDSVADVDNSLATASVPEGTSFFTNGINALGLLGNGDDGA